MVLHPRRPCNGKPGGGGWQWHLKVVDMPGQVYSHPDWTSATVVMHFRCPPG